MRLGKNDAAIGRHGLTQPLDPLGQEEHHGGIVILATAIVAAVEQIADGVEADDVGRCLGEAGAHGLRHPGQSLVIKDHAELRCGEESVPGTGDYGRAKPDLLHALAEIMVLDLRLEIENGHGPWRRKADERHAGRHVGQQADQEVALTHFRCPAQNQQPARRQHPRRNDVLRHG